MGCQSPRGSKFGNGRRIFGWVASKRVIFPARPRLPGGGSPRRRQSRGGRWEGSFWNSRGLFFPAGHFGGLGRGRFLFSPPAADEGLHFRNACTGMQELTEDFAAVERGCAVATSLPAFYGPVAGGRGRKKGAILAGQDGDDGEKGILFPAAPPPRGHRCFGGSENPSILRPWAL